MTTLSSILLYFYKLKGPKLTQAEGYILGVGENIFKRHLRRGCVWGYLLDNDIVVIVGRGLAPAVKKLD